jgi:chromosomal replication initiation ATPase DnaA
VRSAGGWSAVRSLRKAGIFQKSDERILGDGDFVNSVLSDAKEAKNNRYRLLAEGIRFDDIIPVAADLISVEQESLIGPSKERTVVKARALLCYWAVHELGMSMTDVATRLKIAVPTVSVAAKKGRRIVKEEGLALAEV